MNGRDRYVYEAERVAAGVLILWMLTAVACSGGSAGPQGPVPPIGRIPTSIQVLFGNLQTGEVAVNLPSPLGVRVRDAQGNPVEGALVSWRVTSGSGSVEPTAAPTDSTGIAQTVWTLGPRSGNETVEARLGDLEPIVFRALAVPGPPASITVQPVLRPVVVVNTGVRLIAIVQDSFGNGVNAEVEWSTSDPDVASIDGSGLLIGRGFGKVTVLAESGGVVGDREAWVLERTSEDRADDLDGSQIHFVYAVPSDVADRAIDFDGTLLNAISSIQTWFEEQTEGRRLRVDTRRGLPDVSFVRLSSVDRVIADQRGAAVFAISEELEAAGFVAGDKVYVVFYEGTNSFACGNSAWPPQIPGNVAALYLRARTPRGPCDWPFAALPNDPMGVWEFILAHEILHVLGFVDPAAPNADGAHVTDHPRDLMVGGRLDDVRAILDFGNDDYYGPNVPAGVRNLAESPFLSP